MEAQRGEYTETHRDCEATNKAEARGERWPFEKSLGNPLNTFLTQRFIRSENISSDKHMFSFFTSKKDTQLFASIYKGSEPQNVPIVRLKDFFHHTCIKPRGSSHFGKFWLRSSIQ